MGTAYNWAGDAIVRDTIMVDKRVVIGNTGVFIPTDIRDWLSCNRERGYNQRFAGDRTPLSAGGRHL